MSDRLTKNLRFFLVFFVFLLLSILVTYPASANNLDISNVSLTTPSSDLTIKVEFDISWSNSWRNSINHDAAWVFVKYSSDQGSTWYHATLKTSGTNPSNFSIGTGTEVELVVPSDTLGCIVRRSKIGSGNLDTNDIQLVWDYKTDGLSASDSVRVKVFAIEIVYIPEGVFYAGDSSSSACFKQGSADTDPWYISNEEAITTTSGASNGYYYQSAGNTGESGTGTVFSIPAKFSKGYNPFYCMKYEITQGQYTDFLNNITSSMATNDFPNQNGVNRHTITGSHPNFSTTRPDRACNFLSWMDVCAYADWSGLRPMTELEYEKICRGRNIAIAVGEFAWGNTVITAASTISGSENGTETISTSNANCCYNNTSFTGGDGGVGPLRVGIFANSVSTRQTSGSGYYGVMDMGGNVFERCVTVGNATGRLFEGTHGDGVLSTEETFEGYATNADWPGYSGSKTSVTGAAGSGLRGGGFSSSDLWAKVSYRSYAAREDTTRASSYGGRCVLTAP